MTNVILFSILIILVFRIIQAGVIAKDQEDILKELKEIRKALEK